MALVIASTKAPAAPVPRSSADVVARFWSRVRKTRRCWIWTGPPMQGGYGQFHLGDRPRRAHKVAWIIVHGEVPRYLCHKCNQPLCVRPDPEHVYEGSPRANTRDRLLITSRWKHPRRDGLTESYVIEARYRYLRRREETVETLAHRFDTSINVMRNALTGRTFRYVDSPPPVDIRRPPRLNSRRRILLTDTRVVREVAYTTNWRGERLAWRLAEWEGGRCWLKFPRDLADAMVAAEAVEVIEKTIAASKGKAP